MRSRRALSRVSPYGGSIGVLSLMLLLLASRPSYAVEIPLSDHAAGSTPHYEIFITPDPTEPVLFRLHVPAVGDGASFYFIDNDRQDVRPGGLVSMLALTYEGQALRIERSVPGYTVRSNGQPFYIDYELYLHPSVLKPTTWPNNRPRSLRWDEFAYITDSALLRGPGFASGEATVWLHVPDKWAVYAAGAEYSLEADALRLREVKSAALVVGPGLSAVSGSGGVRLVRVGSLPWTDNELLMSLASMLDPLRERGLADQAATYDFVIARYPGALRFNPLISGHHVGDQTFIHWVGVGSYDWWRKHTAADIVAARARATLNLAADAAWFRAGLADYAGLLTLFESGLLDVDGMYQSLRNMFATGARYSGPLWPSLLVAGLSEDRSHEAERVLQFRAPVAVFLFDIELRERSGGQVSLLDWWATLAAVQREQPEQQLYTSDLLPPANVFGDMSAFARMHLFAADDLALDFDRVFERWLAAQK